VGYLLRKGLWFRICYEGVLYISSVPVIKISGTCDEE
jgi:hypothetical protein